MYINAAGASTSVFGRTLTVLSTQSQAACIRSLRTGIVGGNSPASCCVPPFGCSCVFIAVLSMVSWSSSCLRDKAAELFRASWYVLTWSDMCTCLVSPSCYMHTHKSCHFVFTDVSAEAAGLVFPHNHMPMLLCNVRLAVSRPQKC